MAQVAQIVITLDDQGNVQTSTSGGNPLMWAGMLRFADATMMNQVLNAPKASPLTLPKIDLSGLNGLGHPKG